jgi:hypothetical protein
LPSKRKRSQKSAKPEVTFDSAAARLEEILDGPAREQILAAVSEHADLRQSLERLSRSMSAHRFETRSGSGQISLQRIVNRLDARTIEDGFHVLTDWDGVADRFNDVIIPVEVVDYMTTAQIESGTATGTETEHHVRSVLLDYYFYYLLALLTLRIWDAEDPNRALDRVTSLLGKLQGPHGSGQKLADRAEILFFVGTSHFEPDDDAYVRLLARVRTLDEPHRVAAALAIGAMLGSHLRFGFEATYKRDLVALRNDNTPDYPWVLFACETLMQAYARMLEQGVDAEDAHRASVVEGLLNSLSPDPRAFVGNPPPSLSSHLAHHTRFRELFHRHKNALLAELEQHQPGESEYSPICFYFNFSHNVLKGIVVDALLRGRPWEVTLDDLLTGMPRDASLSDSRRRLAETLMGYARKSPDRIAGRLVPVIVYDPRKGQRVYSETLRHVRESSL